MVGDSVATFRETEPVVVTSVSGDCGEFFYVVLHPRDPDRNIPPTSLYGPEISGPDNEVIVCSKENIRTTQRPVSVVVVWSWSLSGPVTPVVVPVPRRALSSVCHSHLGTTPFTYSSTAHGAHHAYPCVPVPTRTHALYRFTLAAGC